MEAQESIVVLYRHFDFLLHPTKGFLMQFVAHDRGATANLPVKTAILALVARVFRAKKCPFLHRKIYVDSYISHSYLTFIKLYHSPADDEVSDI